MAQKVSCQAQALAAMPTTGGSIGDVAGAVVALMFLYRALVVIYRLFLSRLAEFPGPKFATATSWYGAFLNFRNKYSLEVVSGLDDK